MEPDGKAYVYLPDGEREAGTLSYGELDARARAVAAELQALGTAGERALLVYQAGLDFIAAFFGCHYAAVVAVPVEPPRRRRADRLASIAGDAQATLLVTGVQTLPQLRQSLETAGLSGLRCVATDQVSPQLAPRWVDPQVDHDTLAYLQYTSGSTRNPRGVSITHGNVLANCAFIRHLQENDEASVSVTWLPHFHDMGLVEGLLQPVYSGIPCYFMPPVAFLQRPRRWLQAISKYKCTNSGAPNFAYDLCVDKIGPKDRAGLDLSRWRVAYNGAEPIRERTLRRFAEAFEPCGFHRSAFCPVYGLAEATLLVSSGRRDELPVLCEVDAEALGQHRVCETHHPDAERRPTRRLAASGRVQDFVSVRIVDPESRKPCEPDEVGEVWLAGPSVASGYWNRPADTEETFQAFLSTTGEGPFLRTGDLGFVKDGQLFITGRRKHLIIVRGRNHYPQDIELAAQLSHPALAADGAAAFSIERDGQEQLAVLHEVKRSQVRRLRGGEVIQRIRQAVSREQDLEVHAVALLKPGALPRTSSGKIRRHLCRTMFLRDEFATLASSVRESASEQGAPGGLDTSGLLTKTVEERIRVLEQQLQTLIASQLGNLPAAAVDPGKPIGGMGLDSLMAAELANRLEDDLGVIWPMTDFLGDGTIAQLARAGVEALGSGPPRSALPEVPAGDGRAASFGQRRLFFLAQLSPDAAVFALALRMRLAGPLRPAALERALDQVRWRHEVLRTTFATVDGELLQAVGPSAPSPLAVVDLAALAPPVQRREADRIRTRQRERPFDLGEGPLLRAVLVRQGTEEHVLLVTVHHIVCDARSLEVFVGELAALYDASVQGTTDPLPAPRTQYGDFARWQRTRLSEQLAVRQLDYWKEKLAGASFSLFRPAARPARPARRSGSETRRFQVPPSLAGKLTRMSQECGVTLFMLLLAAFKVVLLYRTGSHDVVVGTDVANRDRRCDEHLIGFFVNQLVLRSDLSGNPTFQELLGRIREVVLGALDHRDLPFDTLVRELRPRRHAGESPLFQVKFLLEGRRPAEVLLKDLEPFVPEIDDERMNDVDLTFAVGTGRDGLLGRLAYEKSLFRGEEADEIVAGFKTVLGRVTVSPCVRMRDLLSSLGDSGAEGEKKFSAARARMLEAMKQSGRWGSRSYGR